MVKIKEKNVEFTFKQRDDDNIQENFVISAHDLYQILLYKCTDYCYEQKILDLDIDNIRIT